MFARLRLIVAVLCVTLFTTMALGSQEPPQLGTGDVSIETVSAIGSADNLNHDSQPHLCFQACHVMMALPAVTVFEADRVIADVTPLAIYLPPGTVTGPALLPPIV